MSTEPCQRIARLTPLGDALARVDAFTSPVAPKVLAPWAAVGCVVADDLVAPAGMPAEPCALRDGFAVRAEIIADASSYAPVQLAHLDRVDAGEALPPDTDTVVPLDAVVTRDGRHEVFASVAAGEGVTPAAGDLRAGEILRRAGARVRASDAAVLAVAGINRIAVREPRIRLVHARVESDPMRQAACDLIARAISATGAKVLAGAEAQITDLGSGLADATADAIIAIGGTGTGRNDTSVRTLARAGQLELHGIALSPGETAAFGCVDTRPILLVPGRLDAAVAIWLTLGGRLLACLAAATEEPSVQIMELSRKVASPLGLAEVVPVRLHNGAAEPLASGYWPLSAIAQADGWILVPPESEGYPAGAEVVVRLMP